VSTVTTDFTFADLERMPEDGTRRELLYGELIELPPPKLGHEEIASVIFGSLYMFLRRFNLGRVYGSSMGYKVLSNDRTWLEPDVSVLRMERVHENRGKDYVHGAPDLAVEIISPSESAQDVEDKTEAYFHGGARAVITVYPKRKLVKVQLADGTVRSLHSGDAVSVPEVLPGWALSVDEIFAD